MQGIRIKTPEITLWLLAALLLILGAYGITLGLGENTDSHATLLIIPKLLNGEYEASRNWGAPLYEYLAAYTYQGFGLTAVNALSLGFSLGYLFFIYNIAKRIARSPLHAGLFMIGAVANPLVLINSSIMLETMCALFWFSAALYFALAHLESKKPLSLWLSAGSTALLVLSRPDSALFAIPLGLWLSMQTRKPLQTLLPFIVFGLSDVLVYLYVNSGYTFMIGNFKPSVDPLVRRFAKATLSIVNWLGFLGAMTFMVALFSYIKSSKTLSPYRLTGFIAATVLLYLLRFILLPDELEYLLIPTVLLLLWVAYAFESWLPILGLSLSLVLTNLIHISIFEKTPDDSLKLTLHINSGALLQDWQTRNVRLLYDDPSFISYLLSNSIKTTELTGAFPLHFPGMTTENNDLIISQDKRYVFHNRGKLPEFDLSNYNRIFICEESLYPTRGWRVMQAAPDTSILQKYADRTPLNCQESTG